MGAQSHRESQGDQLSSDWQVGEWADRWIDGLCTCFHQVVVPGGSYQSWLDLCARAPPPRLWAHGLGQCPGSCSCNSYCRHHSCHCCHQPLPVHSNMLALLTHWWSLITIAIKAHSRCPHHQFDERALCLPRLLPDILTAAETTTIIEATEAAAATAREGERRGGPLCSFELSGGPRDRQASRTGGGDGGKFGPGRRSRPGPGGRTSVADAPADPRSDGTARMVVAHSARNYEPTGLGSGCRRGRWGVTGRGGGPVRRGAGGRGRAPCWEQPCAPAPSLQALGERGTAEAKALVNGSSPIGRGGQCPVSGDTGEGGGSIVRRRTWG